jgi:hypothetical protein
MFHIKMMKLNWQKTRKPTAKLTNASRFFVAGPAPRPGGSPEHVRDGHGLDHRLLARLAEVLIKI